jgi:hypothetical protein
MFAAPHISADYTAAFLLDRSILMENVLKSIWVVAEAQPCRILSYMSLSRVIGFIEKTL